MSQEAVSPRHPDGDHRRVDLAEPRVIGGRYRLQAPIAAGGASTMWLARDDRLRRTVAVKELPWSRQAHRDAGRREACAAAEISHAAVVAVYDHIVDVKRQTNWIVMEALSGRSLGSTLHSVRRIGLDEGRYIGAHVLNALSAIHAAGLVHRDVKPANIQLCDGGRVVLTDFGLAGRPCATGGLDDGWIAGSLPYIAPEIMCDGMYSPASDLYALGMTLYVAVTGHVPGNFRSARANFGQTPLPPSCIEPGARPFRRLLLGLLDPDPATRLDAPCAARELTTSDRHLNPNGTR